MNTSIEIQNLKCHGCAHTIETQLRNLAGISEVKVDNDNHLVSFDYNSEDVIVLAKQKLSDLGYPEVGEANSIPKKAKSFVSCAVGRLSKN